MIWRSVMHAHLFNARFGDMIEFHTASCGTCVLVLYGGAGWMQATGKEWLADGHLRMSSSGSTSGTLTS